jgi:hypothetical protein
MRNSLQVRWLALIAGVFLATAILTPHVVIAQESDEPDSAADNDADDESNDPFDEDDDPSDDDSASSDFDAKPMTDDEDWGGPLSTDHSDDAIPVDVDLDPTGAVWEVAEFDSVGDGEVNIAAGTPGDLTGPSGDLPVVRAPRPGRSPGKKPGKKDETTRRIPTAVCRFVRTARRGRHKSTTRSARSSGSRNSRPASRCGNCSIAAAARSSSRTGCSRPRIA